jgi:membrane protease YdiL (CAAX protease family)
MSRAASGRRGAGTSRASTSSLPRADGYFQKSELPLASLAFLLPLVILYEVGTLHYSWNPNHHTEQRIIAFALMQRFFLLFGASGRYLPAMAVVGILLAWHIARRDEWKVSIGTTFGMLLESLCLALPLLLLGRLTTYYVPQAAVSQPDAANLFVLSVGAGIYEELMFRLIAFTLLNFLLIDLLRIRKSWSYLLMVLISAVGFAAYHYLGEEFRWQTFAFRTVAGIYFGIVFIFRGIGITAGVHAGYDIFIILLRLLAHT